jgi:hypothetical protein
MADDKLYKEKLTEIEGTMSGNTSCLVWLGYEEVKVELKWVSGAWSMKWK